MPDFNENELVQLDDLLQRLESQSSMECVVVWYQQSGRYPTAGFWIGNIMLWVVLLVFELLRLGLDHFVILAMALGAQLLGLALGVAVPYLNYTFGNKPQMRRQCELTARAIFQKGRLFQTSRQSGFLVFISWHERQVVLLWDLGIDMKIPIATLKQWENDFQEIFLNKNPISALFRQIESLTVTAAKYMPAIAGNANELPNRLNIKI